jgi:hypothetical protein
MNPYDIALAREAIDLTRLRTHLAIESVAEQSTALLLSRILSDEFDLREDLHLRTVMTKYF